MAWVKAAVTFIASIWGTIKAVMAVAYVIYLWTQYKKAQRSPTYGFDIQTQCSNELPIPVVYGRVKAAGNIVWQEMSEDKSAIRTFVAFSEGEIEGFEDVRANDILISDLPGSSYTEYLGTPTQTLDSRCWQYWVPEVGHEYIYYTGSGTKNVEWIVDVPAHYEGTANDGIAKAGGMRNVAYIAFTIAASDKVSGGMPNFTAIVKGRKVRVWESATETWATKWTENQAWHLLDLLTHTRYGGGYTDNQINIESFKTAAAFCDEILDDGQPRFTEGIIIDWVESLPDIVDQIRFTCRGYVVSYNGELTFKIEQPETPCQHFSMENIVEDSLEIYMPGKDEEWQKVTVTYCEPNQNWAKLPAQSVDESNPLHPVLKDFTIVGVNRFPQASRLAYFYRVYSKYCRFSGKFKTTIRALNRIPGDVITITDDIMGWVEKPVRILEIRHAGDHGHEIYFREYNETIYNDALGSAKPTLSFTKLYNPFTQPSDPIAYVAFQNMRHIEHVWTVPEGFTVEIRKLNPDTLDWEFGAMVNSRIPGNKYVDTNITIGTSVYGLKTINSRGLYSATMLTWTVTVSYIPSANIIVAFDEFELLDGITTDCYIEDGKVILEINEFWDETTDELWDETTEELWGYPTVPLAIYQTQPKDIGRSILSDVKIQDMRFTNGYETYWKHSETDNTLASVEWSAFTPGKYSFRYHQWQLHLMSDDLLYEELTAFKVGIDVPDIELRYPNEQMPVVEITDANQGVRIDFDPIVFTRPPNPTGSPLDQAGYLVWDVHETYAIIKAKNETGFITCNIAVQFKGY